MAIDKINPAQSDLLSRIAAAQLSKSAKPAGELSNRAVSDKEAAKIEKAAKDFETIFLGYLLKSMRRTVTESSLWGDGRDMKLYQAMLDEQLAAQMAESGGIGLAELLAEQLTPKLGDK